jgi:hypothetical protein
VAIELICPGCSKKLRVGEEHAGKSARCPACGTVTPVTSTAALHSRPDATPNSTPASPFASPQSSTPAASATPSATPQSPFGGAQPGGFPASSSQAGGTANLGGAAFGGASGTSGGGGLGSASGGQTATDGRWLLRADNGQTYGPIPRAELDAWVQQGRVSATSYVIREGDAQWQLASDVYPQLKPMTTSASGNPWADAPTPGGFAYPPPSGGYGPAGAYGGYKRPHRGGTIVALAAMSWVICCVFGPIAFFMGQADVRAMKRGEMDDSGLVATRVGMYLGLAHFILAILFVGISIIAAIVEEM